MSALAIAARPDLRRHLRELVRAPQKAHRGIRELVRQGVALLERKLAAIGPLDVLQQRGFDDVGVTLRPGVNPLAVAALFLGRRKGHAVPWHGNVTVV